ncbi:MAG: 4-(cytidine 5'-diphospho)-2-C-methyl-D-erythritol kinase, partial [Bryobacteraceae bacterium]|nr:4-(cytidine 5'-diphospho)-2-C-methyl-D-erythritol kinase [Bryobacteraceae bacterium]
MGARRFQVEAYAKINLGLKVLYRRPDQFHEIRTIFQTISLSDTVELIWEPGRRTKITLEDPLAIPDNLMVRAADAVLAKAKKTGTVRMRLTKRIPMGAGLGGGSADAAAVIRCLAGSFGQALEFDTAVEIAASLGSDIPFFLLGGAVLAMGRGEEMYPLPDLPPAAGLLVCPAVHVSTPKAYQALKRRT